MNREEYDSKVLELLKKREELEQLESKYTDDLQYIKRDIESIDEQLINLARKFIHSIWW